jgi:CheY-like chemotaxis protein
LLTFSRRQSLNRTTVHLANCFAAFRDILATTAKGNVKLDIAVSDDVWPVTIDVSEFEVAMINLIVNARDAMPNGGRTTIGARNESFEQVDAIGPLHGDFVAIEVTDEGVGISAENLAKVFDPFFTTKGADKGTGLGLSQVYGFAHQAGGTVRLASEVGHGTTVTLYLPRGSDDAVVLPKEQAAGPIGGSELVLLVEDNAEVQAIAAAMLKQLGYGVMLANSAAEALAVLQAGEAIDLVLSDIVMPGPMDGIALARRIGAEHPKVKVLLTTGYSQAASGSRSPFPVLRKPYQLPTMARAVRSALEHARTERPQ